MSDHTYQLFEVFGVELEYMIVSKDSLKVLPITDQLFRKVVGEWVADVERGKVAWSNELVTHVVELKSNGPAKAIWPLVMDFHQNISEINQLLDEFNAMLLPTGSHPLMDPHTETVIWPHDFNEIYALYNRIFDCRGHGWANLQSTHINLPFSGDGQFAQLHAAIRLVMPLLPALSASSPLLDGQPTGFLDARLEVYRHNQSKIPSIAGKVIPERAFTQEAYHRMIFQPIVNDIRPYDHNGILDQHFLNSRGAIARFDRGAIEIRVLDIQECPRADLAILELIVAVLQALVDEEWQPLATQQTLHEDRLAAILLDVIRIGPAAIVEDREYLEHFGLDRPATVGEIWQHLYQAVGQRIPSEARPPLELILEKGPLAARILRALPIAPSPAEIIAVYRQLADCLATNQLFAQA